MFYNAIIDTAFKRLTIDQHNRPRLDSRLPNKHQPPSSSDIIHMLKSSVKSKNELGRTTVYEIMYYTE